MQLLQKGYEVRAFVRRREARSERLAAAGAEIFVGNAADADDLARALTGVRRAYLCPPWSPHALQYALAFAAAAADAKLEMIVAMSQWLSHARHPSHSTRQQMLIDRALSWMPGVGVCTVNPGFFADNYLRLLGPVAQLGLFPLPLGDGRNAPPSNEDIARVVVGALERPDLHVGKTYRPTGPKLLSPTEMAAVFAKVLGRKVRYMDAPEWMFGKAARALGIDAYQQSQVRHYMADHRRNAFAVGAPTNHVREVAGVEPESFDAITRRYAENSPHTRRTLGNWFRAAFFFARIPITPAYDLDRFDRQLQVPLLARPELASDSAAWATRHESREAVSAHASLSFE
jgi:NAD(P)H dehydrogenase (quinone)